MADNKESVILDVQLDAGKVAEDLGKVTRQMQVLKQEQKLLNKALEEGRISEEDYGKAMSENAAEMEKAQREVKGYTNTLKVLNKTSEQYGDSLSEQQRKLNDMQKAYDSLDAKYRDSKGGKEFLKQIKEQHDKVLEMEGATGRMGRNVGNYTEALKQAGVGIDGFVGKMKAFLKNPWAILIGAIVSAVKGLVDAFRSSEDRMKELQKAFAPFKAVVDVVKQVFDGLAKSLSGVVMVALEKVTDGVKWLFSAIDRLGKKFGKDWGLSEAFEKAAENSKKATEAEQVYIEHRRRMIESEAKAENEIARLRDQVAQKDKYTSEERIAMLEKAVAIEERVAKDRVKLAKERLAYLEAESNRSENDAAANEELAQARADVTRAETDFFKKSKELQSQLTALRREDAREAKEASTEQAAETENNAKLSKAALDYRLQIQLDALGKEKQYTQEAYEVKMQYFTDLLALYTQDSVDYLNALKAKEQYQAEFAEKQAEFEEQANEFLKQYRDLDLLQEQYDAELAQLDDYHARGLVSEQEYQETKDAIERKYYEQHSKRVASQARELSSAFKSMGDALGTYAEGNEEAAQAQKAFTIMGIALDQAATIADTATAITAAVAGATEAAAAGGPAAPFLLAGYIASMVAAVIAAVAGVASSISQAKQIAQGADAGNFADGGTIKGTSYTGDKLIAHVNSGEGIYTGMQANNLLQEIANNPVRGGIDYELMGATMAAAVAAQPAPVMVYEEMRDFEQKVATYNELASI